MGSVVQERRQGECRRRGGQKVNRKTRTSKETFLLAPASLRCRNPSAGGIPASLHLEPLFVNPRCSDNNAQPPQRQEHRPPSSSSCSCVKVSSWGNSRIISIFHSGGLCIWDRCEEPSISISGSENHIFRENHVPTPFDHSLISIIDQSLNPPTYISTAASPSHQQPSASPPSPPCDPPQSP